MATVVISVTDINDHPPQFDEASYSAHISELTAPGTSVLMVSASDDDESGVS